MALFSDPPSKHTKLTVHTRKAQRQISNNDFHKKKPPSSSKRYYEKWDKGIRREKKGRTIVGQNEPKIFVHIEAVRQSSAAEMVVEVLLQVTMVVVVVVIDDG